jgi:hypothetical protein
MRTVESMHSGLVACIQHMRLVSAMSIPEGEGKRKSPMETLSVFSADPQLS